MADNKNTTGAVHLTSLDLDISALRESAEQVKTTLEDISKTALSTKNSLNGIFDGVGGGGSSGGKDLKSNAKEQQETFKVTLTSLNSLIAKYADLQKKVDDFALSTTNLTDEYDKLRDGVNEAISKLTSYISSFDEKGNLPKEAKEIGVAIAEVAKVLAQYTADYKLYVASLESGNKSYDETVAKLVSLETKYTSLATSVQKMGGTESTEKIRAVANEIQNMLNEIASTGTVTQEQQKRVAEYTATFEQLQLVMAKIKSKQAIELDVTKAQAQVKSLTNSYSEFESKLSRSKLKRDDRFATMADSAKKAREQLENLTSTLQNSKSVDTATAKEIENLKEKLAKLTVELRDAETNARNTGEGFRDLKSKAKESGGVISDFLNKLVDKTKWLLAFELINQARNLFGDMFTTMQETEDAVIELQRVFNDSSLTNESMAKELYEIAYEYGQTFDNVQETAVLFAQTGKSWTEVIEATRAAMLALNTAELDTSQATTGLIAVMSQFKIQASELQEIIDKINITADNFPVTSENIVAALQRAGSAAYNYGMTLEETIGIITALSEATGRSGENLGTSLNSLINFSMKESSLKAFSDYLGGISLAGKDVLEVWTLLSGAIKDGGESLAEMMASNEDFADLFSEEMAETVGALEEYNAAVGNAEDVYSSAGVYRKNYFITLLNNFDTALEAIQNMNDAEGYSIAENEKYMETLTASLNQLQIVAQQLVQQFAEAGLMNIAKGLINIATNVLKLTKDLGGLRTVLVSVVAALASFKIDIILSAFSNIRKGIGNVVASFELFKIALATGEIATLDFATVVKAAAPIITILSTAIAGAIGYFQKMEQEAKEAREELIELGNEATTTSEKIFEAYGKYTSAVANGTEDVSDEQKELLESLGWTEQDIPVLIARYGDLATALEKLYQAEVELQKVSLQESMGAIIESLADIETQSLDDIDALKQLLGYGDGFDFNSDEWTMQLTTYKAALSEVPTSYESLAHMVEFLDEAISNANSTLSTNEKKNNAVYIALVKRRNELGKLLDEYDKQKNWLDILNGVIEYTAENIDSSSSEVKKALTNINEAITKIGEEFDNASKKVDSFQSAYSTIATAVQEYNEKGYLSADNLQKLLELEPEYINLLEIKGEKLYINGEALDNLIQTNDDYIKQQTAAKIAEEALTMAEQYRKVALGELTIEELNAQMATNLLTNDVAQAAYQFLQGKITADEFASALANTADVAIIADGVITDYVNGVTNLAQKYKDVLGLFNQNKGRWKYIPSSGGNSSKTDNTEKEELQAQKKTLQKQKEQQKDYYDELIDLKEKEQKASKEYYEELQEQVKKQKEISDEYYENEIDKLNETQEAQDRLNEALDYYADRQKTLRNLEQAQARSGIEWREKEIEYQESLNDLDKDWNDKLKDWAVDDQISELERLKEEAEKGYEAEIDNLKELQEQQDNLFESEIENLKELKEAAVDAIEAEIDKIEEAIDSISSSVSASYSAGYYKWIVETDKTSDDIETKIGGAFDTVEKKTKSVAENSFEYFNTLFLTPTKDAIEEIAKTAKKMEINEIIVGENGEPEIVSTSTPQINSNVTKDSINKSSQDVLRNSKQDTEFKSSKTQIKTTGDITNNVNIIADIKDTQTADYLTNDIAQSLDKKIREALF